MKRTNPSNADIERYAESLYLAECRPASRGTWKAIPARRREHYRRMARTYLSRK